MMKNESIELNKLVQDLYEKNKDLTEDFTSIQLSEDKWSVKEIFGHLIDSAANNYQRFIRLQEDKELSFPGYGTDWIKKVPYNSYPYASLLTLWKEYNLLLCHIFENLDESDLQNTWNTEKGKLTLEFLVRDYISHLKLHIKHLEERSAELT
ncbi:MULTISPECIES: DinB family protein [unclassified Oceanispirochaeta]|uniref:DinB family protein n=1 Tax=unclassified Oceanispirochaeta TaxID=2635722 RepID=UPI000E0935E6|nr:MULTISPECIES: DinB family protein [unclassified Oceanispirochaeta]MBF9016331.1 DinB family protein [Oceanispirochaeta sp. M2]NPD72794.1 DinB family protein [Oceanispirochaeta sp. M1]RDG31638.1 DinB family protein [Oceanispirochaeta sp. M1]